MSRVTRRTVLRGLGASLALPWLEGLAPPARAAEAAAPSRFVVFMVPNGMHQPAYWPTGSDLDWVPSTILAPLDRWRSTLSILRGVFTVGEQADLEPHLQAGLRLLTGRPQVPWASSVGSAFVSVDQVAAAALGANSPIPSLELSSEGPAICEEAQVGDVPSCQPYWTVSWRNAATPMPRTVDVRRVFDRLFRDDLGLTEAERAKRRRYDQAVVDAVLDDASRLNAKLGSDDRARLDQYLTGVHELERRLTAVTPPPSDACLAGGQEVADAVDLDAELDFQAHVDVMLDLLVLALKCGQTRVASYMLGNVRSERPYPFLGIPQSYHWLSHHGGDADKQALITQIARWQVEVFAGLLDRLAAVPEGDGTLLDHSAVLFCSPIAEPDAHAMIDLPVLVAGGAGGLQGAGLLEASHGIGRVHLALLHALGVQASSFGGETEPISGLG